MAKSAPLPQLTNIPLIQAEQAMATSQQPVIDIQGYCSPKIAQPAISCRSGMNLMRMEYKSQTSSKTETSNVAPTNVKMQLQKSAIPSPIHFGAPCLRNLTADFHQKPKTTSEWPIISLSESSSSSDSTDNEDLASLQGMFFFS